MTHEKLPPSEPEPEPISVPEPEPVLNRRRRIINLFRLIITFIINNINNINYYNYNNYNYNYNYNCNKIYINVITINKM